MLDLVTSVFNGTFVTDAATLAEKLNGIHAYIFDWDGVFNSGAKDDDGCSPFSEVDSMGVNMLRYNHFIRCGTNPIVGIITGESNATAFAFANREHFHAVYFGIKKKADALDHFCAAHDLHPSQVAFFFDDIQDMAVAAACGLRVMVGRSCNPMLIRTAIENNFADYITANDGGNNALREASELLKTISGRYQETILQRAKFTDNYRDYLNSRNVPSPAYFSVADGKITDANYI